jgi:hypothetical protein
MMLTLHEIVGLPSAASSTAIAQAADRHSEELFSRASGGDPGAQRALVELQFAYLVWAYARPALQSAMTHRHQAVA